MHDRHMHDALYRPLKSYVARRGGARLSTHGRMRDSLVEYAVEHWPHDCPSDRLEEVVRARLVLRVQEQYGSLLAAFLISLLVNSLARIIVDWWFERNSHRVLMEGWARAAQNPDVPS